MSRGAVTRWRPKGQPIDYVSCLEVKRQLIQDNDSVEYTETGVMAAG